MKISLSAFDSALTVVLQPYFKVSLSSPNGCHVAGVLWTLTQSVIGIMVGSRRPLLIIHAVCEEEQPGAPKL